jgi:hypothetical protein
MMKLLQFDAMNSFVELLRRPWWQQIWVEEFVVGKTVDIF